MDVEWNGRVGNLGTLKALDPFGKIWAISVVGDEYEAPLYSWERDFSSLFPPKQGWKQEEGELPLPLAEFYPQSSCNWQSL